ncbi:MAG: signal peptidase I [Clostridiales bacterium]|nr:signal peptidase I [Clostridiales bacterium]
MADTQAGKKANGPEEPATLGQSLYSWLQAVAPVIIGIVLVFTFVGRLTPVDGPSMEPTLWHGDMMVVRGMGYTPEQGDVVVLTKPFENITGPIVKRIIAVGGQTVEIDYAANTIYVDGEEIPQDYILEPMEQKSWQTISTITVPEGEVFVMGDNRNVSNDSRNPDLGTVDTRYILGKAELVLFPFRDLGLIR